MKRTKRWFPLKICLALAFLISISATSLAQPGVQAQAPAGTIAYVPADRRDEIRLVQPDGSGDRRLWVSGVADPGGSFAIWSLAWRPGAPELVFNSTHEGWCSLNTADIFTIRADRSGYRRVTEAPACDGLAGYSQGMVQVPVSNTGSSRFNGYILFQGASSAKLVELPPGGNTTITFDQVADFGPGVLQGISFYQGLNRQEPAPGVDVIAGSSTTSAPLQVTRLSNFDFWEVLSPAWRRDGNRIAFVRNSNTLQWLSPNPDPLEYGNPLLGVEEDALPDVITHLTYGPTPGTADQLLYAGAQAFGPGGIYRATEGSSSAGERLVTHQFADTILGLAWLPDGSGFVYSLLKAGSYPDYNHSANLFLYEFGTESTLPLTNFQGEITGRLTVSPDGQTILFERGDQVSSLSELLTSDLWMVNRDGSGLRLFQVNARTPAWSQVDIPTPPSPAAEIYLPVLIR